MNITEINKSIFREYDIRGIINQTLFEKDAFEIGKGFCSLNKNHDLKKIAVCRDGRLSSPNIASALISGLLDSGVDVIDIGCGPTPMLYFAGIKLNTDAGIMVTGSHNPSDHNGFKIVLNNKSFFGTEIQKLYNTILKKDFITGKGSVFKNDIRNEYIDCLLERSGPFPNLKVVWDCGNGATGEVIEELIKKLPGQHKVLFSKIDGSFPNHHPDPTVEKNLKHIKEAMEIEKADLGISFDGDGDRLGVLSQNKELIPGDILTTFLSGSILKIGQNEKIIFDIKSSQTAFDLVKKQNGIPVISKTGHSLIKSKIKETGAPLAGEMSGHIFFNDNWFGFDDALYASLRCLQEIKIREGGLVNYLETIPKSFTSPEIRIDCDEKIKFEAIDKIIQLCSKEYEASKILTLDGIRVTTDAGWWLIRASNTQAALIARAEGFSKKDLNNLLLNINKYLKFIGINWNVDKNL